MPYQLRSLCHSLFAKGTSAPFSPSPSPSPSLLMCPLCIYRDVYV
jgi:hypothetical protein